MSRPPSCTIWPTESAEPTLLSPIKTEAQPSSVRRYLCGWLCRPGGLGRSGLLGNQQEASGTRVFFQVRKTSDSSRCGLSRTYFDFPKREASFEFVANESVFSCLGEYRFDNVAGGLPVSRSVRSRRSRCCG